MHTFDAWYKKDPTFKFDGDLRVADSPSKFAKIRQQVISFSIDSFYDNSQGENWSPNGEARPLIEAAGLCHTSMSVGDVIYDHSQGKFYQVATFGFDEVMP
jgi:hypothetical protein